MIVLRSVRLATRCTAVSHAVNSAFVAGASGAAIARTNSGRWANAAGARRPEPRAQARQGHEVIFEVEGTKARPARAPRVVAIAPRRALGVGDPDLGVISAFRGRAFARVGRRHGDRDLWAARPPQRPLRALSTPTMVLHIIGLGLADEKDITVKCAFG
jgi:hypothetical protein